MGSAVRAVNIEIARNALFQGILESVPKLKDQLNKSQISEYISDALLCKEQAISYVQDLNDLPVEEIYNTAKDKYLELIDPYIDIILSKEKSKCEQ